MKRNSSGEQARVEDTVLVKEAESKLVREGMHAKLAHEHWTGPWRVTAIEQPGSELPGDDERPSDQEEGGGSCQHKDLPRTTGTPAP